MNSKISTQRLSLIFAASVMDYRHVSSRVVDLAMHGGRLFQVILNVVARKVMDLCALFVASPEYLAKSGKPTKLEELSKFPFVCSAGQVVI
ncbi:hypothetical protein O9929_27435 [Vibrio lentus]|nr:hypothetical protein [Vibrio lentus]